MPRRIFFSRAGRAGTGLDFFFAGRDGAGFFFSRDAKNPAPSSLFFAAKKKSSPVDLKNPAPSGALQYSTLHGVHDVGAYSTERFLKEILKKSFG